MNILRKLFGASANPKNKIRSALSQAHKLSNLFSDGEAKDKNKEVQGVIQNLEAALRALDRKTDDEGRPITPAMVGMGLRRMNDSMNARLIWFKLHANTSEEVQQKLYELEDTIKAAADSLI